MPLLEHAQKMPGRKITYQPYRKHIKRKAAGIECQEEAGQPQCLGNQCLDSDERAAGTRLYHQQPNLKQNNPHRLQRYGSAGVDKLKQAQSHYYIYGIRPYMVYPVPGMNSQHTPFAKEQKQYGQACEIKPHQTPHHRRDKSYETKMKCMGKPAVRPYLSDNIPNH
jgi:hypothetical protein